MQSGAMRVELNESDESASIDTSKMTGLGPLSYSHEPRNSRAARAGAGPAAKTDSRGITRTQGVLCPIPHQSGPADKLLTHDRAVLETLAWFVLAYCQPDVRPQRKFSQTCGARRMFDRSAGIQKLFNGSFPARPLKSCCWPFLCAELAPGLPLP